MKSGALNNVLVVVLAMLMVRGGTQVRPIAWAKNLVVLGGLMALNKVFQREGTAGVLRVVVETLRLVPGVNVILSKVLQGEVKGAMKSLVDGASSPDSGATKNRVVHIPETGIPREDILKEMEEDQRKDGSYCKDGKAFALVYYNEAGIFEGMTEKNAEIFTKFSDSLITDTENNNKFKKAIFTKCSHGNALNPLMFPCLRKYENESVSMVASMLHGDEDVVGAMTSGGTESILMAIKAYREMAKENAPHIQNPEIICPITIHPAHEKAGHYFGVKIVHCSVDEKTKRANVNELESLINENTIAIAASAPQYCHCVVDPIEEIGQISLKHDLPFHVDACYGGFILPWIEKLGYDVPRFDFRVPGVTSISADIHKYGYCPKGASFILFKNDSIRKHMYYAYSNWPGGLYISPSMAGTRPGANIALAYATLKSMGQQGYLQQAKAIMETTKQMKEGVRKIPELELVVETNMSGFAFQSTDKNIHIFAVADEMEELGWKMERQTAPMSLHCSILPMHANQNVGAQFAKDLETAVAQVKRKGSKTSEGSAAIYGMVGSIPDKTIVDDFLKGLFSEIYKTK